MRDSNPENNYYNVTLSSSKKVTTMTNRLTDSSESECTAVALPTFHASYLENDREKARKPELFLACKAGNYNAVKRLMEHGADPYHVGDHGWTPLYVACRSGHKLIVNVISYFIIN